MPTPRNDTYQVSSGGTIYAGIGYGVVITQQPVDITVIEPAAATISYAATGVTSSQMWRKSPGGSFVAVSGATGSSYFIPATANSGSGTQYYFVLQPGNVQTNTVTLTINAASAAATAIAFVSGPTSGYVDTQYGPFAIVANGTLSSPVTVTTAAADGTFVPAPGGITLPAGSPVAQTFDYTPTSAGAKSITLTNSGGLTNPAAWAFAATVTAPASGAYRYQDPQLWQTTPQTIPERIVGAGDFDFDQHHLAGYGATWGHVSKVHEWPWVNPGGDWIDASLTPQGTNHWGTVQTANGGPAANYSMVVTAGVQKVQQDGLHNAWRFGSTGTTLRDIAGRNSANPPSMTVRYASAPGVDVTLACRHSWAISSGSTLPSGWLAVIPANPAFLEFELPTEAVSYAAINFRVTTHWSGTDPMAADILNPPKGAADGGLGIAADYGEFDAGITANPAVIFSQRYLDTEPESQYISTFGYDHDYEMSPEFWGGAVDTNKYPYKGFGKWINAQVNGGDLSITRSTDTSIVGFTPLAPGMGALTANARKTAPFEGGEVVDGSHVGNGGTTGSAGRLFLPPEDCGTLRHGNVRFYVCFTQDGGPVELADRKHVYRAGLGNDTNAWWTDFSGKWGPFFQHDSSDGGVSASAGSGRGWTSRFSFTQMIAGSAGPDNQKLAVGWHWHDFQSNAPVGHRYGSTNKIDQGWGKGGVGSGLELGRQYLVEAELKMNTVTVDAPGYIADGYAKVWIDNKLVYDRTGLVFSTLPLFNSTGAPRVSGTSMFGNGGFRDLKIDWFHGGQTISTRNLREHISGLVVTRGGVRIGPMKGLSVPAAPAWKPAAGMAAVISHPYQTHPTVGKAATLAEISPNLMPWWPSAVSPAPFNMNEFSFSGITSYCGVAWDSHNRRILSYGAGHSTVNVTATVAADLKDLSWGWLDIPIPTDGFSKASALGGPNFTAAHIAAGYTQGEVTPGWQEWDGSSTAWGALAQPGKIWPTTQHTYAHQVFIPPAALGNTNGALLSLSSGAGRYETTNQNWSHYQDLDDMQWKRTANKRQSDSALSKGGSCYFPLPINKVFCVASANSPNFTSINTGGNVYDIDVLTPATKTWYKTTRSGGANIGATEAGGLIAHTQTGLLILIAAYNASDVLSYAGTKFKFFAADAAAVAAGTHAWTELSVPAPASWPLKADGTLEGVGFSSPDAQGRCWATDGKHGATTLWKLTPPAGATTPAAGLAGTWTVETVTFGGAAVQALNPFTGAPLTGGSSHGAGMFSIFNRIFFDDLSQTVILVGDGIRDPVLSINTQGL